MKKLLVLSCLVLALVSCSKKKKADGEVYNLESKQVALLEIKGPKEARKLTEVGIINEVIQNGRFQILDKRTVAEAAATFPTSERWQDLGRKIGADYVMEVRIPTYDAQTREGFDSVDENDSVLAEEHHETEKQGRRYVKVRGTVAKITLDFRFFDVAKNEMTIQKSITKEKAYDSRDTGNIRKMHIMEGLIEDALREFFVQVK